MSFPRTTDVAKHLERKYRPTAHLRAQIVPIADAATTDLRLMPERPAPPVPDVPAAIKPDIKH